MSFASSLFWLLIGAVIGLAIGYVLFLIFRKKFALNAAKVSGVYFAVVAALMLLQAIAYWPGASSQIYAELACLAGSSVGWLIGMWLSPMGSNESTEFSRYGTAIGGVAFGVAGKWATDHLLPHANWITLHPFISTLFAVSLLVTTAAVYNSRAYEKHLTLLPRKPTDSTNIKGEVTIKGDVVEIKSGKVAQFYAAIVGPADPLCDWKVLPGNLGTVDSAGMFTAQATGEGRITAFNIEDPTLSNAVAIKVT